VETDSCVQSDQEKQQPMVFFLFLLLVLFVVVYTFSNPLLTPQSLATISTNARIIVHSAARDANTGTTRVACSVDVSNVMARDRLRQLCIQEGLQLCVATNLVDSKGDSIFLGTKVPMPCTKMKCLKEIEEDMKAVLIDWNGLPGPIQSKEKLMVVVSLQLISSPAVKIIQSTAKLIKETPPPTTPPTSTTTRTTTTKTTIHKDMKLLIEFPPPNAQIWSDDLRVSTYIEVENVIEFSKKRDFIRACFSLEKISDKETQSVSFCEELDVSVLRFKGLNNGTYVLTVWMEEKILGSDDPRYTIVTQNTTRLFEVMKGSSIQNEWMVDPRLRLLRPARDPTTPPRYYGWPCTTTTTTTTTPTQEEKKEIPISPTSKSAVPWLNEHQLQIPNHNGKVKHRVWPVTSYAWEHEYTAKKIVLVVGIKVESNAFKYRSVIRSKWYKHHREKKSIMLSIPKKTHFIYFSSLCFAIGKDTWMKNIEHDVRVWFIVGIPNKKISNATLDQVLMEAKTHQDMLIGEHPRWTGSDYPWMVFNVYDSYYTLVRELYENLFHYIYIHVYIYITLC